MQTDLPYTDLPYIALAQLELNVSALGQSLKLEPLPKKAASKPRLSEAAKSVTRVCVWTEALCGHYGFDVQSVFESRFDLCGPYLALIETAGGLQALIITRVSTKWIWLQDETGQATRHDRALVLAELTQSLEPTTNLKPSSLTRWLHVNGLRWSPQPDDTDEDRARTLTQQGRLQALWRLLPKSEQRGLGFGTVMRAVALLFSVTATYGLEALGWGLMVRITLGGIADWGWFAGWALMLGSLIPLKALVHWQQTRLLVDMSSMLRRVLFVRSLSIKPESVKSRGIGLWLGQVFETQAFESFGLNGGLSLVTGLAELGLAFVILAFGAAGIWHCVILLSWLGLTICLSFRLVRALRTWAGRRQTLNNGFIERLLGHETLVCQASLDREADENDRDLAAYMTSSREADTATTPLLTWVPTGWMVAGLLALIPAFWSGHMATASMAFSVGGLIMAQRALSSLAGGMTALGRAGVAWEGVKSVFDETALSVEIQGTSVASEPPGNTAIVEVRHLDFSYKGQSHRSLDRAEICIAADQRVLIEGTSGSGKSTLINLIAGNHMPDRGELNLFGRDRHSTGQAWRDHIGHAPQYQDNHIFGLTLLQNLYVDRAGAIGTADRTRAIDLCTDLGLKALLAAMPNGIDQIVGENGWVLSHGERSRIFLGRVLLRQAALTVLDESFAALDPQTLNLCMRSAIKHSRALVVIAHP